MATKYLGREKDLFLQILANYPIIEDKKTDAYNIEKKKKAWENITVDYNAEVVEKRTTIQLKRLWDKMKRIRKTQLAEARRDVMGTGGGPPKSPVPPQPEIDNLVPYLEYEIQNDCDSDGINLEKIKIILGDDKENTPASSSSAPVTFTPSSKNSVKMRKKDNINELTDARLQLIKQEAQNMKDLHNIRMEGAIYRREAARLMFLQEEVKLECLKKQK